MAHRIGKYTIGFDKLPSIHTSVAVVGKKESEGPLKDYFDIVNTDTTFGEKTWEQAESALQKKAAETLFLKSGFDPSGFDYIFAGDLLNQCIASSFGIKDFHIPFVGIYGACSTMAESMAVASVFLDSGAAHRCVALTSSHFCTAERQFRLPMAYGGQRPPTSQWTVTGSGAVALTVEDTPPFIKAVTFGKIEDLGVTDANNMGAAMAPSAASTIENFLKDTKTSPENYDLILTGDLGKVGTSLLYELLERDNIDIKKNHQDCGLLMFDIEKQDVHSGASGCGCAGSVFSSLIVQKLKNKELNNILFIATGALLSSTSTQQGESIPCVAHLLHISNSK